MLQESEIHQTSILEDDHLREVMLQLSSKAIYVSTGSACAARNVKPSHVISAMKRDRKIANSSLRLSLGTKTTDNEISLCIKNIKKIFLDL